MAVVITGNNTPTAGGITYGDGTTYANTAAGTSGQPIVSGGAGAPVFRPYTLPAADGSASQVLQTNGSGALSFATPAGGLNLLSTVTASASATVDIETTFSSTYDKYLLAVSGVVMDTDGENFTMRLKIGGTYLATSTYVSFRINGSSASTTVSGENTSVGAPTSSQAVTGSTGNVGGENTSFNMYIHNPASATLQKLYFIDGATHTPAGEVRLIKWVGFNTNTAALTGVRFIPSSGTFASGTFRLYGLANS